MGQCAAVTLDCFGRFTFFVSNVSLNVNKKCLGMLGVSETPRSCGVDQVEPGKALDNSTHLGEKTADRTGECDRSMKQSGGSEFVWFSNFLKFLKFRSSLSHRNLALGMRS